MKGNLTPTKEAIKEALKNPNGWVYVIKEEYRGLDNIPPTAIVGAWKVDQNGKIHGAFIPNPSYKV